MRVIDTAERRARLARRHALAPQHRVAATRAMTVLHATEPATPYLSLFARIDSFTREEVDDALFESKSLIKQLANRAHGSGTRGAGRTPGGGQTARGLARRGDGHGGVQVPANYAGSAVNRAVRPTTSANRLVR
jgi:hypothetical protein